MRLIICFLAFSAPLFAQGALKPPVSIGVSLLTSRDYLIQTPDGQASFTFLAPVNYRTLDVQVNIPLSRWFRIETGYRLKKHTAGYRTSDFGSIAWVETAHSIPLRPGVVLRLPRAGWLGRLSCNLSGGVLFDFMQQSPGKPAGGSSQTIVSNPTGVYVINDEYRPDEFNQVKSAVSLNGQAMLSLKVLKFLSVDAGYGYVKGSKTLATGHYTYRGPMGLLESGKMTTKGTYRYWALGLSYIFQGKLHSS